MQEGQGAVVTRDTTRVIGLSVIVDPSAGSEVVGIFSPYAFVAVYCPRGEQDSLAFRNRIWSQGRLSNSVSDCNGDL